MKGNWVQMFFSPSPSNISASDRQHYRFHLQLDSTEILLQKYCTSETCWVKAIAWTNWNHCQVGFCIPAQASPHCPDWAVTSGLEASFNPERGAWAVSTACWPGVYPCCKAQTESQTSLTLVRLKKDQYSDTFWQTPIGRPGVCISKTHLPPSIPLFPFPEAPYASLTVQFLW